MKSKKIDVKKLDLAWIHLEGVPLHINWIKFKTGDSFFLPCLQCKKLINEIKYKAEKYGPQLLVDGYLARDILIDNPEAHKALDRWVGVHTATPESVEKIAESQYDEDKSKHATIGN